MKQFCENIETVLSDVNDCGTNKKPRRSGILYKRFLRLGGSAHGAHTSARAAGHAGVSVDHKLAVALGDGGNGTLFCAGAAGHALVTDLISHNKCLLFFVGTIIHPNPEKCNIQIIENANPPGKAVNYG